MPDLGAPWDNMLEPLRAATGQPRSPGLSTAVRWCGAPATRRPSASWLHLRQAGFHPRDDGFGGLYGLHGVVRVVFVGGNEVLVAVEGQLALAPEALRDSADLGDVFGDRLR